MTSAWEERCTIAEALSQLRVSSDMNVMSFPIILNASRRMSDPLPGDDDTDRMLALIGLMLDDGFIPITSPYEWPPCEPWPETERGAILARIEREWLALEEEVSFLDICWFTRPEHLAASQAAARMNSGRG